MKIALSIAHEPNSVGAKRGVFTEYGMSCHVTGILAERLQRRGHEVYIIGSGTLSWKTNRINDLNCDVGVEIHFNSSIHPTTKGAMCLHAGSKQGEKLAEIIGRRISEVLGVGDLKPKLGKYQLDPKNKLLYILRKTNCPFVVVEPCYLSNDDDLTSVNMSLIAFAVCDGLELYAS